LHIDYPRIPPPRDGGDFTSRVRAGEELVALLAEPLEVESSAVADPDARRAGPAPASAISGFAIGHHRPLAQGTGNPERLAEIRERLARLSALIARLPW